jgi:hypothetical protein
LKKENKNPVEMVEKACYEILGRIRSDVSYDVYLKLLIDVSKKYFPNNGDRSKLEHPIHWVLHESGAIEIYSELNPEYKQDKPETAKNYTIVGTSETFERNVTYVRKKKTRGLRKPLKQYEKHILVNS